MQAAHRLQPDAVVMDVQMPRLSGYVAARLLKEDWATADIPVVLLTSLDAASDRYWGDQAGADRYLTKDFQAEELGQALREVLAAADEARGGPRLYPDPVELDADEVWERTCEVFDRTLFQTSLAASMTALAATCPDLESTIAGVLGVIGAVVESSLAGVVLVGERTAYVTVNQGVSQAHYREFLRRSAEVVSASIGAPFAMEELTHAPRRPGGLARRRSTTRPRPTSRPSCRCRCAVPAPAGPGSVIGILALSSAIPDAFGDAAMTTLRLLEASAGLVVDNGRLREHTLHAAAAGALPRPASPYPRSGDRSSAEDWSDDSSAEGSPKLEHVAVPSAPCLTGAASDPVKAEVSCGVRALHPELRARTAGGRSTRSPSTTRSWKTSQAVIAADKAGFKYVWVTEHHFLDEYSHLSANDVVLSYLAAKTERIHLGSGIFNPLPQVNHPAKVAERVAYLDHVSDGRFEFGTGRGAGSHEILGFLPGIESTDATKEIWEDVIGEFAKMWTQETYEGYDGKYWSLPPRKILPKPLHKPHPPMWYAAGNPASYEMAGRKGLGVLGFSLDEVEKVDRVLTPYKQGGRERRPGRRVRQRQHAGRHRRVRRRGQPRRRAGATSTRDPNYLISNVFRYHDTMPRPEGIPYWPDRIPARDARAWSTRTIAAGQVILGDPDEALAQCKRWEATGIDQIVLRYRSGADRGDPRDDPADRPARHPEDRHRSRVSRATNRLAADVHRTARGSGLDRRPAGPTRAGRCSSWPARRKSRSSRP